MDRGKWCTIESDPGVFTELIQAFGVKGAQVEELASMEESDFNEFRPIYGLVFLFKWDKKLYQKEKQIAYVPDLFFANQIVSNACATQALLSILLNLTEIDIGEHLRNFKDFSIGLDPKQRGQVLETADVIRVAHNSFAHPEPFEYEEVAAKEGDDVFHFVSYLPFKGKVYELDGFQKGPALVGPIEEGKDWLEVAKIEIMKRMQEYTTNEIHFNLLAICGDRKEAFQNKLKADKTLKCAIGKKLGIVQIEEFVVTEEEEKKLNLPIDEAELKKLYAEADSRISRNVVEFQLEEEKRKKWHNENIRRKHNYLALIFELLTILARKDKLPSLIEKAKEEEKKRKEAKKKEEKEATEAKAAKEAKETKEDKKPDIKEVKKPETKEGP